MLKIALIFQKTFRVKKERKRKKDDIHGTKYWWAVSELYRTGHLDLDCNNRSDRIEWGHIKYHSVFRPQQAYELIAQWLCATGTIVTDLVGVDWGENFISLLLIILTFLDFVSVSVRCHHLCHVASAHFLSYFPCLV